MLLIAAAALLRRSPGEKAADAERDRRRSAGQRVADDRSADDLLVMDLASGGRVVIQLAPAFAPVHVANIQALARGNYWDGATIYRVQDNYVAQWGQQ